MTKTLNQIIFYSLHQKQNIFFSNIGNQNIFLEKKHNPPPFKLNGRFLIPIRNSKNHRQQTKWPKVKGTNNDLQTTSQKTKDRLTGNWLFYESLYTELLYSILMAVSESLLLVISTFQLGAYSRLCEITLLNMMSV